LNDPINSMNPHASFASAIMCWLYFAICESSAMQATLGKKVLGLKVVDLSSRHIGFGRATGRWFGKYVSMLTIFIGFIMAGLTARKQGLHDLMAGTLVVYGKPA
jgi:uncharacterized RDD family membrane protein YckC